VTGLLNSPLDREEDARLLGRSEGRAAARMMVPVGPTRRRWCRSRHTRQRRHRASDARGRAPVDSIPATAWIRASADNGKQREQRQVDGQPDVGAGPPAARGRSRPSCQGSMIGWAEHDEGWWRAAGITPDPRRLSAARAVDARVTGRRRRGGGTSGRDLAAEQLDAREHIRLRHARPAHAHGEMRGAGRLLGEQHLGHLGGRADREAVGGQAAELLLGPSGGVDRDALEAPGENRPRTSPAEKGAARRIAVSLVGSADHLEQPADLDPGGRAPPSARAAGEGPSPAPRTRPRAAPAPRASHRRCGRARAMPAGTCEPTRMGGRGRWMGARGES